MSCGPGGSSRPGRGSGRYRHGGPRGPSNYDAQVADLTIDELARRTGFTVRNVRSHQTRGLLPGPEMRGRVGYYGEEHVERLRLIQQLQDDGLPLRLVEKLLTSNAGAADQTLALRRAIVAPMHDGAEPARDTIAELAERFGIIDDQTFQRAIELGALVPHVDGTYSLPLPGLLDVAEEIVGHGVPLSRAVLVAHHVHLLCQQAATTFVDMVRDEVWQPFAEDGGSAERWPQIAATIAEIRPLASEIFLQLLPTAIAEASDRAFGEALRVQAEAAPTSPPAP